MVFHGVSHVQFVHPVKLGPSGSPAQSLVESSTQHIEVQQGEGGFLLVRVWDTTPLTWKQKAGSPPAQPVQKAEMHVPLTNIAFVLPLAMTGAPYMPPAKKDAAKDAQAEAPAAKAGYGGKRAG